jgi:hypothetical protein
MGFKKEVKKYGKTIEQKQLCIVVPKIIAEQIDDLSLQMGVSRSQYLRQGIMEFHNYQKDLRKRHQDGGIPIQ